MQTVGTSHDWYVRLLLIYFFVAVLSAAFLDLEWKLSIKKKEKRHNRLDQHLSSCLQSGLAKPKLGLLWLRAKRSAAPIGVWHIGQRHLTVFDTQKEEYQASNGKRLGNQSQTYSSLKPELLFSEANKWIFNRVGVSSSEDNLHYKQNTTKAANVVLRRARSTK